MSFSLATQVAPLRDCLWAWLSPPVAVGSWGLLSEHSLQIPEEGLVSDDLQAVRASGGVAAAFGSSEGVMLRVKPPPPTPSQCFTTTPNPTPKKSHSTACLSMSVFSPGQREGAFGLPHTEVASAGVGALNHWGRPVIK